MVSESCFSNLEILIILIKFFCQNSKENKWIFVNVPHSGTTSFKKTNKKGCLLQDSIFYRLIANISKATAEILQLS